MWNLCADEDGPTCTGYEIRVKGSLGRTWSERFPSLQIRAERGATVLTGSIDQSLLHALFRAFRDGAVFVISVRPATDSSKEVNLSFSEKDPVRRRAELGAAILFLFTAAASIVGEVLLAPILNAGDVLAAVSERPATLVLGALLWSANNIGIVFIAVFLYPFLRPRNVFVATGYLTVRIIEGTLMMVGILAVLLFLPLANEYQSAGSPRDGIFTLMAQLLKEAKVLGISKLSLPLLGLGGVMFTWFLFRAKLVPAAIALTGFVGYALVLAGGLAGWFDLVEASPFAASSLLAVPVAVFEIVLLPFWLIFKGFNITTGDKS
jgi:hypothetical protein